MAGNESLVSGATALFLAIVGLLLHPGWLTTQSLSAGDWRWVSDGQLASWFPLPTIWDGANAFGLKTFASSNQFPLFWIEGGLAQIGIPWNLSEKLLYFWPFAIMVLIAPWLLARAVLGKSPWALLAPAIFAGNTYLLLLERFHLTIGMSDVLACLVLASVIHAIRLFSLKWSLISGLLLSTEAIYDLRITYLTVLLIALLLLISILMDPRPRATLWRLFLVGGPLLLLLGTQSYWWMPFISYGGDHALPIAATPWIAFMRLAHGITAVHPFWTGAIPADFRTAPVNPLYFAFAIVAFMPLVHPKVRPEVAWLSISALAAAFLIKQDNFPAGAVYIWMFNHLPGWNLFREASKLFLIVAAAYAVLIPLSLQWIWRRGTSSTQKIAARCVAACIAALIVGLSVWNFIPSVRGDLGYATRPQALPGSFRTVSTLLDRDATYGPVLWLGGPSYNVNGEERVFTITSSKHPLVVLSGAADSGDPFSTFCFDPGLQFCYLDDHLLPYLLERTGARYVVVPSGNSVGSMPQAVNRGWLTRRVTQILGQSASVGTGSDALSLWRLDPHRTPVIRSPAVAVIDGDQHVTQSVLPALTALAIPSTYGTQNLVSRADLETMIHILPNIGGSCRSPSAGAYTILAHQSKGLLKTVQQNGRMISLTMVTNNLKIAGWALYGPVTLREGSNDITAKGVELGPCISWSPLTAALLDPRIQSSQSLSGFLRNEQVLAQPGRSYGWWIELKRSYDVGWTMANADAHVIGDGLFNLYHSSKLSSNARFEFGFVTTQAERVGWLVAGVSLGLGLLVYLAAAFYQRGKASISSAQVETKTAASLFLRPLAVAGLILLVLASLESAITWWSLSVPLLGVTATVDPYGATEVWIACAMAILMTVAIARVIFDGVGRALRHRRAGAWK